MHLTHIARLFCLAAPALLPARAEVARIDIDATRAASPPADDHPNMQGAAPDGSRLAVNSRFLTLDGRPWFPVMAEIHFSRYPERYWEEEILKMKAGGVTIVATYIFWIHHEEVEGQFDWSGQRDLRRFVELCRKHGMRVWLRIGPWAHGECRNGGFPDWVARLGAVRQNDPKYLGYVSRLYGEIGRQIQGLYWKDGGPIIGVQLENEYGQRGPGKGAEHYAELKRLAIKAGIEVPFYSLTGWGNPDFPAQELLPVWGGYPDGFWQQTLDQLPPSDLYKFSNERSDASLAADLAKRKAGNPLGHALFPYLTAEMGGGMQVAYHRRPVIQPDDVGSILLTRLGSGVVLYGYYMFHGGANPEGKLSTMQESRATRYSNDLPVISYDFQAPLGQYGQMRPSFRILKSMHLFLRDFGSDLAPMATWLPTGKPLVRAAARMRNGRGYVFFNNYQRESSLPDHAEVQVALQTALQASGETLAIPRRPFKLSSGAYFMWPVNLNVEGAVLKYASAQLLCKLEREETYFFFASPGVEPELAWDAKTVKSVTAPGGAIERDDGRVYVTGVKPGTGIAAVVETPSGKKMRIVVLTREQALNAWKLSLAGREVLLLSDADVYVDGDRLHLRSRNNEMKFSVYPASNAFPKAAAVKRGRVDGAFAAYSASVPRKDVAVRVEKVREAAPAVPEKTVKGMAVIPDDSEFERAAVWRIRFPEHALDGLSDVFFSIRYAGSVGRLYRGNRLLDDNFYNGTPWEIGWKRFAGTPGNGDLTLQVMPLRKDSAMYIERGYWPDFPAGNEVAALKEVRAIPEYEIVLTGGAK